MSEPDGKIDLDGLGFSVGEGRCLDASVELEQLEFGGELYQPEPAQCPVKLEVSRINGDGWALHLAYSATLKGRCMRCLEPASQELAIDSREVDQRSSEAGVESPYVDDGELDIGAWARDTLALAVPAQVLCREGCLGLCPRCGENLNENPGHEHPADKDPRWSKLDELRFD